MVQYGHFCSREIGFTIGRSGFHPGLTVSGRIILSSEPGRLDANGAPIAAATDHTAKTYYMLAADGSCYGTTTTCTGTTWRPQPRVGITKPFSSHTVNPHTQDGDRVALTEDKRQARNDENMPKMENNSGMYILASAQTHYEAASRKLPVRNC